MKNSTVLKSFLDIAPTLTIFVSDIIARFVKYMFKHFDMLENDSDDDDGQQLSGEEISLSDIRT